MEKKFKKLDLTILQLVKKMINRKISIHLQDFPDLSFISENKDLIDDMDFVRLVCSSALSIRDNKNLRVRLPLSALTIIGKNSSRALNYKDIIADEVNVKNVFIEERFDEFAELKLQVNFKKIGAKYGSKIKEITSCVKENKWTQISSSEVEIASVKLVDDEFEIKLSSKIKDNDEFVLMPLATNDCLVKLDIKITKDLLDEGMSRDIIRAIQQARKDADLDVSERINILIHSKDDNLLNVIKKYDEYIKNNVLATSIEFQNEDIIAKQSKFYSRSSVEELKMIIGIKN